MTTNTTTQPARLNPLAVADRIARELGETEKVPVAQIRRIVYRCGADQALAWLEATHQAEANGGLLIQDGSRRRTPGGVYLFLARAEMTPELRDEIFPRWQAKRVKKDGEPTPQTAPAAPVPPAAPTAPVFDWKDRGTLITEASENKGVLTAVKVTLIGRPGKVIEKQGFVLLVLEKSGPLPSLPKGIPVPSKVLPTQFIAYIGAKQWAKVKEAIKQPEDGLIIEGTCILEEQYNAITVFATNVSTKQLQRTAKETQQPKQAA